MAPHTRFLLIGIGVATILLVVTTRTQSSAVQQEVNFTYSGSTGPEYWGTLSPAYAACSNGKIQSPIDISRKNSRFSLLSRPLIRDYHNLNATLINNIINIEVLLGSGFGGVNVDGKKYNITNLHWHSPSEHTIDGVRYDLELHMVHKSADGNLSVVAVLYRIGRPDPILSQIKSHLDLLAKEVDAGNKGADHIPIELLRTDALKLDMTYWRYMGSLTTSPCTEKVLWTILGKVREISMEELASLKAPLHTTYKNNARPSQLLNGRYVQRYGVIYMMNTK